MCFYEIHSCEDNLNKRVLVVYYSFTQQTRLLLKKFGAGMESKGIDVHFERLEPLNPFEFPFLTDFRLATVMVRTFFRQRNEIQPVSDRCYEEWDYVVLAGPTWSYHPSGPMLDFLDRFGEKVLKDKKVVPFISCRSYWRVHYLSLKHILSKVGAIPLPPLVFEHPTREPYRFIGLFLQLRGKMIRKNWFRKHYAFYGHNKEQGEDAFLYGEKLGESMLDI